MTRAACRVLWYAVLLWFDHVLYRATETRWRHYERLDRALDDLLWRLTEQEN